MFNHLKKSIFKIKCINFYFKKYFLFECQFNYRTTRQCDVNLQSCITNYKTNYHCTCFLYFCPQQCTRIIPLSLVYVFQSSSRDSHNAIVCWLQCWQCLIGWFFFHYHWLVLHCHLIYYAHCTLTLHQRLWSVVKKCKFSFKTSIWLTFNGHYLWQKCQQ